MRRDNFNDRDDLDDDVFDLFSKQIQDLHLTDIDVVKDSPNLGNFKKLISKLANEHANQYINLLKRNSFMLLKDNIENTDSINAENNYVEIDNNVDDNVKNDSRDFVCVLCLKNFETMMSYEMHMRYCIHEGDSNLDRNKWEYFGVNDLIVPEENEINLVNGNEAQIYDIIDENYLASSNANNSYHSHAQSQHDSYHSANSLDYNDPNMNYEDLIRLDENLNNQLDPFYLSMFVPEKLEATTISHLSDESKKCLICFEEFEINNSIIRLPCFHIFHEEELLYWFRENKKCPICRVDIEEFLNKY